MWKGEWGSQPLDLYEGLRKHEATALFMLRTEVLALKNWLVRIGVPDVEPWCTCSTPQAPVRQTLRHVLTFCPDRVEERIRWRERTGWSEARLEDLLHDKEKARWTARWLLETGPLDQFRAAIEIEGESVEEWAPFERE